MVNYHLFWAFMAFFCVFCLYSKSNHLHLQDNIMRLLSKYQLNTLIMNKTELTDKIAAGANLTKADAKSALDATLKAIKEALAAGEKVQLVGFGTFAVSERPARDYKNPRTGEVVPVEAKKVAKFKAGAELNDVVNA